MIPHNHKRFTLTLPDGSIIFVLGDPDMDDATREAIRGLAAAAIRHMQRQDGLEPDAPDAPEGD